MRYLDDKDEFYKKLKDNSRDIEKKYDDISEICGEHLADLLYDGFKVIASRNFIRISKDYEMYRHIENFDNTFKWSDISNDVITFIYAMKDEYNITGITLYYKSKDRREILLNKIERIKDEDGVYCIDLNADIRTW